MIKTEGVAVSSADEPDFSGLEGGDEQAAEDAVQEVVNWYNAQIIAERRAPVPDEERIEELKAGRQAALDDQAHRLSGLGHLNLGYTWGQA